MIHHTSNECMRCGQDLVVGDNITQSRIDKHDYICRLCLAERNHEYYIRNKDEINKRSSEYRYRTGRRHPMNENRKCPLFLGVHVAERVLRHVFKDVEVMPYGNPGYDIKCNRDKLIDVKSSCIYHSETCADRWQFHIRRNKIADYFVLLAFDNRKELNPEHIWLVPGKIINDKTGVCITNTRLAKWDIYEMDVDNVVDCCNIIRGK